MSWLENVFLDQCKEKKNQHKAEATGAPYLVFS